MSDEDAAFLAITQLFSGQTVSPPPRYYNDAGHLFDVYRTCGWVANALFEPDPDEENIASFSYFEPSHQAVIKAPYDQIDYKTGQIKTSEYNFGDIAKAMETCFNVMSSPTDTKEEPFTRITSKILSDKFVNDLKTRIRERGRLESNGGWPNLNDSDKKFFQDFASGLVRASTNNRLDVVITDKTDPVRAITYPVRAENRNSKREASFALGALAKIVENIALVRERADAVIRDVENKKIAERQHKDFVNAERERFLGSYGEHLASSGGIAEKIILDYLSGRSVPAFYKISKKRPNPERDLLVDELRSYVGDEIEALKGIIGTDMQREKDGLKAIERVLAAKYDAGPSLSV